MSRRKRKRRGLGRAVAVLALLAVAAAAIMIGHNLAGGDDQPKEEAAEPRTVTVGNAGDVILHKPFITAGTYKKDGDYDFSPCFTYMEDVYAESDYMTVNLETTLPGPPYQGYPCFRSPDSIADALTSKGADMLLLANNHINDSGRQGLERTPAILDEKGIDNTGVRTSAEEKRYEVKDVDGIKIAFINYTYETPYAGGKAINANPVDEEVAPLLNSFDPGDMEPFYEEMRENIAGAKEDGAEYIIALLHWGEEYQLEPSQFQKDTAKELCSMGVDALLGGHPHVVQPVDAVKDDEGNLMFCAYSTGNHLSNQRRQYMGIKTGETEDGLILQLHITKDAEGKVSLTGVDYVPTWVRMTGGPAYQILPADDPDSVEEVTGISGIRGDIKASHDRTWDIIGEGAERVDEAFGLQ